MNGTDFNVSVRGDNQPAANKLLVMVDGRSIYMTHKVLFSGNCFTSPCGNQADRSIEGPASAIYGFNTDGIINIITKSLKR